MNNIPVSSVLLNGIKESNPAGDGEVVDAGQIFLQLQKLLEVLHLHHGALQLQHHL